MSEPGSESREPVSGDPDEDFVPTPFDGPFFLPVVLLGLTCWFAYDGWFSDDPSMAEWWWFNQGGAIVFGLWGSWLLYRALQDRAGSQD